jgi:hypothetical protein
MILKAGAMTLRPVSRETLLAASLLSASCAAATSWEDATFAAFAGVALDNQWEEVFTAPGDLAFQDAGLAGVAVSVPIWVTDPDYALEIEGQIVRHFGAQDHWELNAPVVVARWRRFPWDGTVDTSAAFGLGLSLASETPRLEVEQEGQSSPVMAYWMIEAEVAAPDAPWSLFGRLHHRSTAYGLFGEEGGLNALVAGARKRF